MKQQPATDNQQREAKGQRPPRGQAEDALIKDRPE